MRNKAWLLIALIFGNSIVAALQKDLINNCYNDAITTTQLAEQQDWFVETNPISNAIGVKTGTFQCFSIASGYLISEAIKAYLHTEHAQIAALMLANVAEIKAGTSTVGATGRISLYAQAW